MPQCNFVYRSIILKQVIRLYLCFNIYLCTYILLRRDVYKLFQVKYLTLHLHIDIKIPYHVMGLKRITIFESQARFTQVSTVFCNARTRISLSFTCQYTTFSIRFINLVHIAYHCVLYLHRTYVLYAKKKNTKI